MIIFSSSQKYGWRILEALFGAFLLIAVFFNAQAAENRFLPVVSEFEVLTANEVDGGVEFTGTMMKARDCVPKEMTVYVTQDDKGIPEPVLFEYNDEIHSLDEDKSKPNENLKTRASIEQKWGPWTIFIPGEYDTADISIYMRHSCHSFYDTYGKLHEFSVTKDVENDAITVTNKTLNK